MLPMVAKGQTASLHDSANWTKTPVVRQKQGDADNDSWLTGGFHRSRTGWYLEMPSGIGDLVSSNFVDGYSLGPHTTFGRILANRNRWEIEETVRYALDRKAWLAKGALRWYAPIEQGMMLELHGGRHTEDFDHDPYMSAGQNSMAAALFAFDDAKLLERTEAGIRFALPLGAAFDLTGNLSWERRARMENHLYKSLFGVEVEDNTPRIRQQDALHERILYDGPVDGEMGLLNLQLSYQPHRTIYVYDDMTCDVRSSAPLFALKADAGMGKWRYLSLGLEVSQQIAVAGADGLFSYHLGGGGILHHGELSLVDWHHFNANRFWWQNRYHLSHFALLSNYELSTDRSWIEGHVEWLSNRQFLTRLSPDSRQVREYVQLHSLLVPDRPFHWEFHYGIEAAGVLRLGFALDTDGYQIHNFGIVFSLNMEAARALGKQSKK